MAANEEHVHEAGEMLRQLADDHDLYGPASAPEPVLLASWALASDEERERMGW